MDIEFNKNEDNMKQALSQLRNRFQKITLGGGVDSIDKQHEKKKLTARERLAYLLDSDKPFLEIGAFAGYEMYEEYGGCPAAEPLRACIKAAGSSRSRGTLRAICRCTS